MRNWLTSWLYAPWRTAGRRRTLGSVAISAFVHGSLLAGCAFWFLTHQSPTERLPIRTAWQDGTLPQITPIDPLPVTITPIEGEAGGNSLGAAPFHQTDGTNGEAVSLQTASLSSLDTTGQLPVNNSETELVGVAGGQGMGEAAGEGRGQGTGDGDGLGDGGTFFGLVPDGRRVVYVVDASRSMNQPHPGPMKTRFGRVKLELVRSISAMTSEQEFFIVYFNNKAWPMPARTLTLAVPSAQQRYLRWAVEARANGTTDPEEALLVALTLNPDVIYFLTDGAFRPNVVDHVREANNRSRIKIHTIGFGDDGGETMLKEIAFQNWGTYQFIPGDETADPSS